MSSMWTLKQVLKGALMFASLCGAAQASSFSALVVYGDSLSDNGNLFAVSGQPGSPYFQGRRSNGPVAVEYLASALGVPLVDFAWIGATTGIGNYGDGGTPTAAGLFSLPGMQLELATTQAFLGPLLSDGLFVVWGGPNDFLSPSALDVTASDTAARAVGNLVGIVAELKGLGANHILVPGMPDLGLTPYFQGLGPVAASQVSLLTNAFNSALQATLPDDVRFFDTASFGRSVIANPAAFGLTNVTDPCFDGLNLCSDPARYFYFDDFHPTTATAALIAGQFHAAVVPLPPSLLLLLSGVALPLAMSRRRIK